jgi:hypothetical protein
MKKILLGLLLAMSLISFKPITKSHLATSNVKTEKSLVCKYGQCQANAKSTGKQCKHCVSKEGDRFCFQHK